MNAMQIYHIYLKSSELHGIYFLTQIIVKILGVVYSAGQCWVNKHQGWLFWLDVSGFSGKWSQCLE